MIKVKFMDPEHGDQELMLEEAAAADFILKKKREGKVGYVRFDDGTLLDFPKTHAAVVPAGPVETVDQEEIDTLQMMQRTGVLEQLEARSGEQVTIVPLIAGG